MKQSILPSLSNHKLSNNAYLVKTLSVVQQIRISK